MKDSDQTQMGARSADLGQVPRDLETLELPHVIQKN
jgi:hypothetical protein